MVAERERAGMLAFIRRLLDAFAERDRGIAENVLPRVSGPELDRLVGVALTVTEKPHIKAGGCGCKPGTC